MREVSVPIFFGGMGHRLRKAAAAVLLFGPLSPVPGREEAGDWPQWRHDAARSACSPQDLSGDLRFHWVREFRPWRPAWPDQPRMTFDAALRPVVSGRTLFVGLPGQDAVVALDTRTGEERWRVFTDGPVRLPPAVWKDGVLAVSDDGYLYCLEAATGSLRWRFRGGPGDRRVLGNGRLISAWPARGGPVVADGVVYFAAGIWPFMGVSIHALEAGTGRLLWSNEEEGSRFLLQPHRAEAFGGVAPQGPLAVAGDRLLIPGGRSVPACHDRSTGKLVHYRPADAPRRGGFEVVPAGGVYFVDGAAFDLESGLPVGELGAAPVVAEGGLFWAGRDRGISSMEMPSLEWVETEDRKGKKSRRRVWRRPPTAAFPAPAAQVLIRAGNRLFGGGDGGVWAFDPALRQVTWSAPVEGRVLDLAAADGRLFASTREGRIYCFGPGEREGVPRRGDSPGPPREDGGNSEAEAILDLAGVREGYALLWGLGKGRRLEDLIRGSRLHLVVVDPDPRRVEEARRRLDAAGWYGDRVAVHAGDPARFPFPPYVSSLTVVEEGLVLDREGAGRLFDALRPFGGVACLGAGSARREDLEAWIPEAKVREEGRFLRVSRPGAPPGSGDWTHEHADASNTRVSRDRRVRAPLGMLWFGGSSHEGLLPRHGHGPQPQAVGGRIFVEGVDLIRALDLYTGRVLWESRLPGLGALFDNVLHQPGANASGSNFVSLPDGIYVAYGRSCLRLDPATGRILKEFRLPPARGDTEVPLWGYLNVCEEVLIGGAEPLVGRMPSPPADPRAGDDDPDEERPKEDLLAARSGLDPDFFSSSRRLVAMDRHEGKVLWSVEARLGFRHNGICAGGGRVYCIDRLPGVRAERLKREGRTPPAAPRLAALDLGTGRELWATEEDVFGTWLSYSSAHDILVESGRVARDTLRDEPRGMRAYRASDGKVLWMRRDYAGPAMIQGDTILMAGAACDLRTGELRGRFHPLTGLPEAWTWRRSYGCNTPAASAHLLTFRSGMAGYFDLERDGGTGNFGGFRSGCSHNLVVAGGVLCAPDYTRTCLCGYPNQTSLALVPLPSGEMWTYFGSSEVRGPVRRVGVNLGAPGDRRAEDGTLWIEHPSVAGRSPSVPVRLVPEKAEVFRLHPMGVEGEGPAWVAASGVRGIRSVGITMDREGRKERSYEVRLHFLEPDPAVGPGDRVFDVFLQGRRVLGGFDIVREAGGPRRGVVRGFSAIPVTKELVVELAPVRGREPLLCGIEAATAFDEPLFRCARERWRADPYEAEVYLRGSPEGTSREELEALERASGRANLEVRRRPGMDPPVAGGTGAGWIVLREPVLEGGRDRILWSGPLEEGVTERLVDSPVRKELVRRLLSGEAVVWLLLEGDRDEPGEAARARLEAVLRDIARRLSGGPVETSGGRGHPSFSVLRVAPEDPAEEVTVRILRAAGPEGIPGPMVFAVAGRGRIFGARPLGEVDEAWVSGICATLGGPHRGESKRAHSGMDLLLAASWDGVFGPRWPAEVLLVPGRRAPGGADEEPEGGGEPAGEIPRGGPRWIPAVLLGAVTFLLGLLLWGRRRGG